MVVIDDTQHRKVILSKDYNLFFNKLTGLMVRYGRTKDDDPEYCPYGPEILDLEISSAAEDDVNSDNQFVIHTNHGCCAIGCENICYKSQNKETYYEILLDNGETHVVNKEVGQKLRIGDDYCV